jgi:hypothetical protein
VLPDQLHLELADTASHDPTSEDVAPLPAAQAKRSGVRAGTGGRVSWAEIERRPD